MERRTSTMDINHHEDVLHSSPPHRSAAEYSQAAHPEMGDDTTDPQRFSFEDSPEEDRSPIDNWALSPNESLSIDTHENISPPSTQTSPVISPLGHYASTTDDDDGLTLSAAAVTSTSTLIRRRSSRSTHLKPPPITTPAPHDYGETEKWGWIILIITWIVFVVGMGSVLGVWSWAWDVGETPYAPPELEDDPTLPIVGYYPCLIILTAVMAWVWVVVAWVGMKYFRHARFVDGEE